MDVQTLSALSRLLDEALEMPPERRAQWIDELPEEYRALAPHLRNLLLRPTGVETDELLRTLPKLHVPITEGAGAAATAGSPGDAIGHYRLVRHLGSGGMASVWLAERTDGLLKRPVALKLPFGAWPRAGLADRMAREREILETLDHPHIARLLDAGLTEAGQPFLALEYVEGQPIDVYCREQALDLRARIRLFIQIAEAVAYAHARLVVHRDLKPANILVTQEGQAKLLDFGIAKLLEQGLAHETRLTRVAGRALTPDYASPEQIAGEPVGTGSDVYSLGVVLYELLTGNRPYRLQRDSSRALERAVLEAEPVRPSDSATDESVRRALRGDLDTIVLKALRKASAERYPTVNAFSDDLQRYLSGQPILARADAPWYRARKFVARNKLGVIAAAAVLIAIVGGAAVAMWQARVALAEQKRAEEVKEFIASIFRDASPYESGGAPTALDLLRQARGKLERRLEETPEVRVELLGILGTSLLAMNDVDAAEKVLQRAVDDANSTLGPEHRQTLHARVLFTTVDRFRGRAEQMQKTLDELIPKLRRNGPASHEFLVTALQNHAHWAIDRGEYGQAISAAREALELARATYGREHMQTVGTAIILATAHLFARDWDLALQVAKETNEVAGEVFADAPLHPAAIEARATYAKALAASGDPVTAVPILSEAIEDLGTVFGENSKEVGFYTGELVLYQWRAGQIADAVRSSRKVLQILGPIAEEGSYTHAAANNLVGVSLLHARRGSEALPYLRRAAESMRKSLGETHPRTLNAQANVLLGLARAGEIDSALAQLDKLLAQVRDREADPALARSYYAAGVLQRLAGNPAAAIELQRQALALLKDDPETRLDRLESQAELGIATGELGEHDAAAQQLETALASLRQAQTRMTPVQAEVLTALARARTALGDAESGRALRAQADQFWNDFRARLP